MIKRIKIRNFQAHRRLVIDLDPHVTCIIGESDCGKSSILRALRWLATNRPSGTSFIRKQERDPNRGDNGKRLCIVEVWCEGSSGSGRIKRKRGISSAGSYAYEGHVFRAVGSNVPSPIANVLNIGEVNFQGQHDSPYWFMKTPGEVSRSLNEIVNLDLIDSSLRHIAFKLRDTVRLVTWTKERASVAKQKEEETAWVVVAHKEWHMVEKAEASVEHHRKSMNCLHFLLETADDTDYRIVDKQAKEGENLVIVGERVLALGTQNEGLDRLIETLENAKKEETQWTKEYAKANADLRANLQMMEQCPLCGRT